MARKQSLWLTLAALLAITGGIAAQDAPAPGPAPASPGGGVTGGGGTPTQQQMNAMAAAFNQDIVLNSDLYSSVPEILSGGLGFTNIIGAPQTRVGPEHRVATARERKEPVLPGGSASISSTWAPFSWEL